MRLLVAVRRAGHIGVATSFAGACSALLLSAAISAWPASSDELFAVFGVLTPSVGASLAAGGFVSPLWEVECTAARAIRSLEVLLFCGLTLTCLISADVLAVALVGRAPSMVLLRNGVAMAGLALLMTAGGLARWAWLLPSAIGLASLTAAGFSRDPQSLNFLIAPTSSLYAWTLSVTILMVGLLAIRVGRNDVRRIIIG